MELMDTYFKDNPDTDKIRNWGEYIAQHDHECNYMEKVLYYLEKTRQYNALLAYFNRYKMLIDQDIVEGKVDFEKELQEIKAAEPVSHEALALRYFILGKTHELNQVLRELPLTRYNFHFYIQGDKVFRHKAYDYCVRHDLSESLIGNFVGFQGDIIVAEFLEYTGSLPLAARHYKYSRQYLKAAGLYEQAEKYRDAGNCYFQLNDYQTALAMYKKEKPPDHAKIAKTYERLKDYESALIYWKKAGNKKAMQRCIEKIERKSQRKLPFPDS